MQPKHYKLHSWILETANSVYLRVIRIVGCKVLGGITVSTDFDHWRYTLQSQCHWTATLTYAQQT